MILDNVSWKGVNLMKIKNVFQRYETKYIISQTQKQEIIESEQVKWLNEHAREYGFIIRYPKEAEAKTGKFYQPLTLRYVGDKTLEEHFDFIAFLSGDK